MNHGVTTFICKARVLIEYSGKFLLLEHQFGDKIMLILPGGKVEAFDETQSEIIHNLNGDGKDRNDSDILLNALRREVYEELKINLPQVIDYCCSHFFTNTQGEPVIDVVFYVKLEERPNIVVDGEEVKSFVWMDQKEILSHDHVHDWLKKILNIFDKID
ncbi:MAG: NUDIX hydrolase [Puniceicoccales bacterium]|jgi:8-oxo-dGTP pyrophosphatase MutT (NUDIX family)|nr:NUDIX hydrolase [Puniceicoccales bacterium]